MERGHYSGAPQQGWDRVRKLQKYLTDDACRQDIAEDNLLPPVTTASVLGACLRIKVDSDRTVNNRDSIRGQSTARLGTEETFGVRVLYRSH